MKKDMRNLNLVPVFLMVVLVITLLFYVKLTFTNKSKSGVDLCEDEFFRAAMLGQSQAPIIPKSVVYEDKEED